MAISERQDKMELPPETTGAVHRIERAFTFLREHFIGRDAALEQILFALLTREHALIIGDRGLAKSRLARSVFCQFTDDRPPFSLQLTRSTSVGQLVGGLDLEQFERGVYTHNLEGYIVRAHFAFLDELFDANDFVLRALNGILNEREFLNGPQVEKAALHTAIATTNFIRDTRESRAVLDRFLFKTIVRRAESALQRLKIRREFLTSHGGTVHPEPGQDVPFADLRLLSGIVHGECPGVTIRVPAHFLVMLDDIISSFERDMNEMVTTGERFVFSDRTKNKAIHVAMASALRAGRTLVESRDLASLQYLIPTIGNPAEEEAFDRALNQALKTFVPRDREAMDRAAALIDVVEEMVARHHAGTLHEPKFGERLRTRLGKWMHKPEHALTLGGLLDEARALNADAPLVQRMKDEVIQLLREAHERHHIPYETKLGG